MLADKELCWTIRWFLLLSTLSVHMQRRLHLHVSSGAIHHVKPSCNSKLCFNRASSHSLMAWYPDMICSDQRVRGLPSNLHLSDVAAAIYATLPQQQEQLAAIKRRAAVTSTRLKWQTKR